MPQIRINDRISYIPACEKPISGDVGIVHGDEFTYVYDTGSIPETLETLQKLEGKCDIVISHFHGDHTWWLTSHRRGDEGVAPDDTLSLTYERPGYRNLYVGSLTQKYIPEGIKIEEPLIINDGVKLEIFPLPNSHCKGSLAMMVDDEYMFIGDSSYCMMKDGKALYNSQQLKALIDLLKEKPASRMLISHDKKFVRNKAVLIRQLESIYEHRTPDSPYIYV